MPILTPCADTGPASNNAHAATAADNNCDLIFVSPKSILKLTYYFIALRLPIYFE